MAGVTVFLNHCYLFVCLAQFLGPHEINMMSGRVSSLIFVKEGKRSIQD